MITSMREKIGFSYTDYFKSIVVLAFALATALHKLHFCSLRNKMVNLVLVIKYHSDFRLQFDIKKGFSKVLQKSCPILLRATTRHNFLSSDQQLLGNA